MIKTGPDGRRRSERTKEEDQAAVVDAMALLPIDPRSLFEALFSEKDPVKADRLGQELENGLYHTKPVSMEQFIDDPYYLGDSMTTLFPALRGLLIEMFNAPYREVLLAGAIGYGKCVDGDTELYDPVAGRRVTVREASLGSLGVVAWDGTAGTAAAARAVQSGWKSLGWLTMRSGVRVRMSADHPVLTADGFVPVARLVPGDLVASLRRTPPPVRPLDVGDAEVIWVAYMLADGGSTQTSMTFTNMDPVLHAEFEEVTAALGDDDPVVDAASGCRFVRYDGKSRTVCPHGMQWLRRKYNLTRPSRTKRAPASFYGLSDRQLGLFLNRIWACDGWISRHLSGWEVGICLASEAFVRDIQQLLLRFGIRARMRPRTMHYRYKGERRERPAWSLEMHDCGSVRHFLEAVGDVRGKEETCRTARQELRGVIGNPNVDITPMDGEARKRLRREMGPFPRGTWWGNRPQHQRLGNDAMRRLGVEVDLPIWCRWWADVFWDEVVSYEPGAVAEPVFDVEVPAHANFTPQGMIVHNTYLASIAMCRIIYELSCLRDPQGTFGIGPGTEMVIMLISKSLPLCREVLKTAVDDKIKLSPYFMGKFPPKFSTDFTLFPNNIRLTIGSYGAERALGKAVVASVCDECLGKNSLLTLRNGDTLIEHTVGDLWRMTEEERDGLQLEALDHATGRRTWTHFRMRESTVQPLVRIEAANTCSLSMAVEPSLDHPVLVRRGDWLIYVPAFDVRVGDETVWRVSDGEEGRASVGGDEGEAAGIPAGELHSRAAGADVGAGEGTTCIRELGPTESCPEGEGTSVVREDLYGRDAGPDECFAEAACTSEAYRRGAPADLGGERAFDPGSGADVPVSCVVAVWGDGPLPIVARRVPGTAPVRDARGAERDWRGSDGTHSVHAAGATALDGGGLLGDTGRRDTGGGRRQIADELLQRAGPGADRVAVAVGRGARDATDHRAELEAPAERVAGTVCDGGVHGGGTKSAGAMPHHADGRALGGCRDECLPVASLPSEFCLARVTATTTLPPEQTYSIETACQTFVADGCVVHNTNFPPKRNAQQIQQTMGKQLTAAHFDIVEKVYRSLVRRIKSRFQKVGGDLPGMVILASSAATLDSFTERKIREAATDPDVFVIEHTQWSARPKDFFCGEVFYVLCSKSSLRSRIMDAEEAETITEEYLKEHEAWMVEVPVEYRDDFEGNLEDSLRDIAGVSTQAISAFFQRVEAIDDCVVPRTHPFSKETWIAGGPGAFNWDQMCRKVERRLPGGFTEDAWVPKESPSSPRWIHIDASVSGDATGFVMGRIDRWIEVVRRDGDGNRYTDAAPYYIVELVLSIRPPAGEQIYMPDVRRLVYELQAHGYPIAGFSTDTYQYVEMHQQVRRHGIHTELISVDTSMDPYEELKSAIYEHRIEYYAHGVLLSELRSLEYDRIKGKVDHPKSKSKDLSDALAGVVWGLHQRAGRLPWAADADTPKIKMGHEHQWVSPLIPAEEVDFEEVRAAQCSMQDSELLPPILMGDDD